MLYVLFNDVFYTLKICMLSELCKWLKNYETTPLLFHYVVTAFFSSSSAIALKVQRCMLQRLFETLSQRTANYKVMEKT